VTVEFLPSGRETTLLFQHQGEFSPVARKGHACGWLNVLETLARWLDREESPPTPE
jgi:hypothetical protein